MQRTLLSAKIHRAVVTDANLNYIGSITVDSDLMDAAGMVEFEQVHVVDVESGSRFVTYLIRGEPDSGIICVNGAAARLVQPGDHIIILAFAQISDTEMADFSPTVVHVDERNRMTIPEFTVS